MDYKWIAEYFEGEFRRLKKIEDGAKEQEASLVGDIAKYDHLISLETVHDEEHKRAKRISEKALLHSRTVLENITPKLDKMAEQLALAQSLIK